MKKICLFCFVFAVIFTKAYSQETGDILVKNATVLTITDGILEDTDVLVIDGKIKQIGKALRASKSVRIVDATGKFVMPGIIDAHSHIGISNVNEASSPVSAEVWVGDVLKPADIKLYRALAGGVTISHAMHGSANAIGGQCETIKHRYGTLDPEVMRMEGAPRTIKFALGENPMRVHGEGNSIVPRTRMGIEQVFRRAFSEGRAYKKAKSDFAAGRIKEKPKYSLRLETIEDILDGEIIIHCHSYRADEILMLMRVCEDFNVRKLVFQHVNEGFKVAPELAKWGASASVFSDWWAYKLEVYYSTAYNAAILTKNGVLTSINSDDSELIRHLYHEAAKSQKYGGLTDNEALRLITLNPAIQLGIADRVGSIELGKDGDLVIFDKHPLSIYTIPQMTIIDGIVRFDMENDPIDNRLDIDPAAEIPAYQEAKGNTHENCMHGTHHLFQSFHRHNH